MTITGPGGAGKTRLALAVAAAIAARFTAGVQFVSLASITNPELVVTALAGALEIQQVANRTIPQLIGDQLQNAGPFLLLLDNFEQVLPAATVVAEILEACPSLKILVTSRSRLRIYGEQEFPVTPLEQNSAIELFVQRAAAVWPDFAITSENAIAIREICSAWTDCLWPLNWLPPEPGCSRPAPYSTVAKPTAIVDRWRLDLPERQQTLRKTIDWSHDLLNEAERKLFRRLSAFVGGCTLEAAEAVCNTSRDLGIDMVEGLSSLVDKNLVQRVDRAEIVPRFVMLETIREYAQEQLLDGLEQSQCGAHMQPIASSVGEGNPELGSADRSRWLSQCDVEIDNLSFALDWLFQTAGSGLGVPSV